MHGFDNDVLYFINEKLINITMTRLGLDITSALF